MPDLTKVYAKLNDIDRKLEKKTGGTLQLTRNRTPQGAPLQGGWFVEKRDFRATGGKKFYELIVDDVKNARVQDLAVADGCIWNNRHFKFTNRDEPTGDTNEYIFELQPL